MRPTAPLLVFILSVCVSTGSAQKQSANMIKNGDFERFSADEPTGWETSNIPGTLTVVSAAPSGHKGTRGVKCAVKDFYGTKIAGVMSQKNIALLGRYLQFSGYYVFHPVGKDAAAAIITFQNSSGSTIGSEEVNIREEKSEFLQFVQEIMAPPDARTINLRLMILGDPETGTLHVGSFAVFDDLELVALPPKERPAAQTSDSVKTK